MTYGIDDAFRINVVRYRKEKCRMAGKSTNIDIVKARFREMFSLRGLSEKRLGLMLEDKGIVTYRQLQRNLQEEKMNRHTLLACARILDCSDNYLTGALTLPASKLNPKFADSFKDYIDSAGFYCGHFYDPAQSVKYELFFNWLFNDETIDIQNYCTTEEEFSQITDSLDFYEDVRNYVVDLLKEYID